MTATVVLVEARPRVIADGAPVTVRLAGGGAAVPYLYGGEHWRGGIVGLPKSIASLDFDGEQLGGGAVAQAMELRWGPGKGAALAEMAGRYWTDAPIVVRIGPEGDALPPVAAEGLVLDVAVGDGMLAIALGDQAVDLKRPVLVDRYAGTGGVEGPVEFKDQIKPRSWGRCFNVLGRSIDTAANIFVFGDPRRAWSAIDQVRDAGAITDPATMTLLAWQGSAEATFAALRLAQAIAGGGVLAPSIACVKWWTAPAGDLHADVRGETAGGYVETAAEIAARIIANRSTIAMAPGALAQAVAARPAPFGCRVDNEATTAADAISAMLGDVSLSWMLVDNAIEFRAWDWGAPTRVARSHAVTRRSTVAPVGSRRLGYRRNWAPMARGDLAASVLAADVRYEDGTPVEALKPATPGATAGAPSGTTVGGVVQPDGSITGGVPAAQVVGDLDIALGSLLTEMLRNATYRGETDQVVYLPDGTPVRTVIQVLSAIVDGATAYIADLRQVDGDGNLKAAIVLNSQGHVTGITQLNDGETGSFYVVADEFGFVDPNGGNPKKPLFYLNGKLYLDDVYIRKLDVGVVTTAALAGGSVTGLSSYSFADTMIAASETVLAEITALVIGDGADGRALTMFSLTQDGASVADTAVRLRAYVDIGNGYVLIRDKLSGIRTSGADTKWSLPVAFPVSIMASGAVRVKLTAQGTNLAGGGSNSGSYARDIQIDVFKGFR